MQCTRTVTTRHHLNISDHKKDTALILKNWIKSIFRWLCFDLDLIHIFLSWHETLKESNYLLPTSILLGFIWERLSQWKIIYGLKLDKYICSEKIRIFWEVWYGLYHWHRNVIQRHCRPFDLRNYVGEA